MGRYSTIMSDTEDKPMKAAPSRPPYLQLVKDAITEIGNPKGSSRVAITKHVLEKYPDLDSDRSKIYLRNAFRVGLKNEVLVLARKEGKGAGSYKIAKTAADGEKVKKKAPKKVPAKSADAGKESIKKAAPEKAKKKAAKGEDEEVPKKKSVKKLAEKKATKSPAAK